MDKKKQKNYNSCFLCMLYKIYIKINTAMIKCFKVIIDLCNIREQTALNQSLMTENLITSTSILPIHSILSSTW